MTKTKTNVVPPTTPEEAAQTQAVTGTQGVPVTVVKLTQPIVDPAELADRDNQLRAKEAELKQQEAALKAKVAEFVKLQQQAAAANPAPAASPAPAPVPAANPATEPGGENALSDLQKMQADVMSNMRMTVHLETEDCWTQMKKGFCTGVGVAAGATLVVGAVQLLISLCGGGSSD